MEKRSWIETLKEWALGLLGIVLHSAGCLVYLTVWGIALIVALSLGSCVLRSCAEFIR